MEGKVAGCQPVSKLDGDLMSVIDGHSCGVSMCAWQHQHQKHLVQECSSFLLQPYGNYLVHSGIMPSILTQYRSHKGLKNPSWHSLQTWRYHWIESIIEYVPINHLVQCQCICAAFFYSKFKKFLSEVFGLTECITLIQISQELLCLRCIS